MARKVRPKRYSREIGLKICELYATSYKSMQSIIEENDDLPTLGTLYEWRRDNPEFENMYTRAGIDKGDTTMEAVMDLAHSREKDDTPFTGINHVHRDRLIFDVHKFVASRISTAKWGDPKRVADEDDKEASKPSGVSNEQFAQLIAACLGNKSTE